MMLHPNLIVNIEHTTESIQRKNKHKIVLIEMWLLESCNKEELIETLTDIAMIQFEAAEKIRLDKQKAMLNAVISLQCQPLQDSFTCKIYNYLSAILKLEE